jgi:hypothetical protein
MAHKNPKIDMKDPMNWLVIVALIISILYFASDCSMGGGSVPSNTRFR